MNLFELLGGGLADCLQLLLLPLLLQLEPGLLSLVPEVDQASRQSRGSSAKAGSGGVVDGSGQVGRCRINKTGCVALG